ncbi:MAG: helix-turn-helix domain-containing protein [Coriobacteriia bacterium]|nr:helix-turn-helix domain-containing protein [Coriobacteriia bacterium]
MSPKCPPLQLRELPDLLTVNEVAALLRIGRGKAYTLVRTGALPSVTLGRSLRVPKAALERFLQGGS